MTVLWQVQGVDFVDDLFVCIQFHSPVNVNPLNTKLSPKNTVF